MDKGLIILMSLAGILTVTIILASMGILSSIHVQAVILISLIYHTGYTIYAMVVWNGRKRIRNKKRGNLRPPRPSRDNY